MSLRKLTDEELEIALREANAEQLKILSKSELINLFLSEQLNRKTAYKDLEEQRKKSFRYEENYLDLKKKCLEKVQKNLDT